MLAKLHTFISGKKVKTITKYVLTSIFSAIIAVTVSDWVRGQGDRKTYQHLLGTMCTDTISTLSTLRGIKNQNPAPMLLPAPDTAHNLFLLNNDLVRLMPELVSSKVLITFKDIQKNQSLFMAPKNRNLQNPDISKMLETHQSLLEELILVVGKERENGCA